MKRTVLNKIISWICTRFPKLIKNDAIFLKIKFWGATGIRLNLDAPKTFNAKLQWLKLYDRNPQYTIMVDKYAVKNYVSNKIGAEYIIPTIGVWDSVDEIDFDKLPSRFVLKCTHDSGGLVICQNKELLDISLAKEKLKRSLKSNYYWSGREWPYKNVKPRIIAEQYMADNLYDYKAFCFNEMPRMVLVYSNLYCNDGIKEVFYDEALKHFKIQNSLHDNTIFKTQRPKQYTLLHNLAMYLSAKISLGRCDFYEIKEQFYWGEITTDLMNVSEAFPSEEWNANWGELLVYPRSGKSVEIRENACIRAKIVKDSVTIIISIHNDEVNEHSKALIDYKFFCFNGVADSVMVCRGRETGNPEFYFFDKRWQLKKYNKRGMMVSDDFTLPKPDCIDEMFSIAEKLSKGIPFVRVDLFCIDGLIYFGEMTFYPDSGFDMNIVKDADAYLGKLLILPERIR